MLNFVFIFVVFVRVIKYINFERIFWLPNIIRQDPPSIF